MAFTEKEQKLFALAMDPAAKKGEIENAAAALIKSLRDRGIDAHSGEHKSFTPKQAPPPPPPNTKSHEKWSSEDWPGTIVMGFGKHKGKRLAEIDPSYMRWCLNNWDHDRSGDLLAAMAWLLEDLHNKQRNKY
jgi:hypothetical protein